MEKEKSNKFKKIMMLKLYNGDMIIGENVENTDTANLGFTVNYVFDNPRAIVIMPTMNGSVKIAMGSVCEPFRVDRLRKRIVINAAQVMFSLSEDEIDNELINGYKSEISGIRLASAADAAAINSSATRVGPVDFAL